MYRCLILAFVLCASCKKEKTELSNAGKEVAGLIDPAAQCVAERDDSAVCRVNGAMLLCSREGCQPIKFVPPSAEQPKPASGSGSAQ